MLPAFATNFSQTFSGTQTLAYIIISVLNAVMLFFASMKFILVLQQCGYKGKKYFKWLTSSDTPYLSRLMLLCLLALLFSCVLNLSFVPVFTTIAGIDGSRVASYVGFASYALFALVYIKSESAINAKVPLRKTKRLVRLCITYLILLALITFGLIVLLNYIAYILGSELFSIIRFAFICAMPILMPYILFLAYSINEPFENKIKKYYIRKTTEKLKNSDVIKIGITGSFAKTSVKEILKTILSQKYRVLSTFGSYNTPMGISLTTKKLDNTYDIFIAEMGARYKGDIKVLADMVKPTYCVLTGINVQHLETFKSEENIKDTKFELFDNPNKNKIGFFACNTEGSMELYNRFDGEKYLGGIGNEDALAFATDITVSSTGTEFNLNIKGEKPVACKTVLLGRHSIKNICLASAVAYKIGMTPEEISVGINRLSSIEHRLELVPNNKNMVIIDDSYNSNVDGTKSAMEVLDAFSGRKIVVTPGLVELGKIENVANAEFGRILAKHADIVIVVGKHNAETIINGLIDGGMDKKNIIFAKNLKKGNEELNAILSDGDVVLFENDLPDNYN